MSRGARACWVRLFPSVRGGAVRLLACLLLLSAGCLKNRHTENDPLVGGPLPGAGGTGGTGGSTAVATGTGQDPAGGQPPMQVPASTTSTAALATGVDQQLDPGSTLRIIGTTPGQGQPGGVLISRPQPLADQGSSIPGSTGFPTTTNPTFGNSAVDAPVALTGQVEPVRGISQGGLPAVTPGPLSGPISSPPGGSEYDRLMEALRARGATDFSLQQVPASNDGWACLCSIPHPTESGYNLRINAQASGEHGLAAIRAAVAEIDSKLQAARPGRP